MSSGLSGKGFLPYIRSMPATRQFAQNCWEETRAGTSWNCCALRRGGITFHGQMSRPSIMTSSAEQTLVDLAAWERPSFGGAGGPDQAPGVCLPEASDSWYRPKDHRAHRRLSGKIRDLGRRAVRRRRILRPGDCLSPTPITMRTLPNWKRYRPGAGPTQAEKRGSGCPDDQTWPRPDPHRRGGGAYHEIVAAELMRVFPKLKIRVQAVENQFRAPDNRGRPLGRGRTS